MTEGLHLCRPSIELREPYLAFHREWVESGERMVPWVIARDPADFEGMLAFLAGGETGAGDGRVPDSTYWLVSADGRVLGVSNLRHTLNERLLREGGHIGYGIRPLQRRRGYATALLALTLERARGLGLTRALLCCDAGNVGSERTIRRNGGVADESFTRPDGGTVLRFWIDLGSGIP